MAMPVRTRRAPNQPLFVVNQDASLLDNVYRKVLGKEGDQMLPEELKWLAVTHKSFDHARRGFNDRLAYLGKRIVDLQCSLALLNAPQMLGRTSSQHTALKGLDNVTQLAKTETLDRFRLAQVAQSYGLDKVVRWKPRKVDDLKTSGVDVVLAQTMYSIVGAVALHRGGEAANRIARERILSPLGLR
ncbi:ribonuclease-III-like-domain-containing protein [Delphinella strobiligena]|nr:ribonuclease-III-like-domain-containing protein [Delphinella strobiligena]